mmetsp:Transcript_19868/g.48778  ORF Transcript_19868/g.48778 Transcript_19868/m.48778 type:complete len:158 (+) Transcript_19868:109-582(+)
MNESLSSKDHTTVYRASVQVSQQKTHLLETHLPQTHQDAVSSESDVSSESESDDGRLADAMGDSSSSSSSSVKILAEQSGKISKAVSNFSDSSSPHKYSRAFLITTSDPLVHRQPSRSIIMILVVSTAGDDDSSALASSILFFHNASSINDVVSNLM